MMCPQCGNDNPPKLKFCVKCGMNLLNPQEINYEQVDMGKYHSEEEPASSGFKLGSGTFTIKDSAQVNNSSDLYTAAELNESEDDFDFSSIDEPFIPKLDAGRIAVPHPNKQSGMYGSQQPAMNGMPGAPMNGMQGTPMNGMQGMPNMNGNMNGMYGAPQQQPMNGMPGAPMNGMQQGIPNMNSVPPQGQQNMGMNPYGQPMMMQPQIIGYDPTGMPIYGQPMMMQPQIIGYDPNGMPIYSQPMMMQPQIVGYDQNGMPVYGQMPMMYQPPVMGENGEMMQNPYGQHMGYPGMPMQGMPNMNAMPQQPYGMPQPQPVQQPPQPQQPAEDDSRVDVPDDFWEFFDGGKATEHKNNDGMDDFFGKHSNDMGSPNGDPRLKRFERKKVDYMGDTPIVDASKLNPNTDAKFNKLYMRQTAQVNAGDLKAKENEPRYNYMGATKNVNANDLAAYEHHRPNVDYMGSAGEVDARKLEAYVPEHKEAIMSAEVRKVDALPKKRTTYNDEIDAIELPEYMKARKTARDDSPEIPGLPEI